jgi:hypothetical protein
MMRKKDPIGKLSVRPARGLKDRSVHYVTVREAGGRRVVSVHPNIISARAKIASILIQRKADAGGPGDGE